MRIYETFKEMYSEVLRDVAELGIRTKSESVQNKQDVGEEYDMKEIIGYSYELTNTEGYLSSFSPKELDWLNQEFVERISLRKINPGEAWKLRPEVWGPLRNSRGRFDYTYNERMRLQLKALMNELRIRPNTRQAVMTIYSNDDIRYLGGYRRIPCSLSYQFVLRTGTVSSQKKYLHVVYNMRSCDVAIHFRFDVALACMLINYVAGQIACLPGSLIHNIGSLHIFRKDMGGIF
jgi:thymidylate synthase